jgi:DNA-binding transcriptional LysR family regulator
MTNFAPGNPDSAPANAAERLTPVHKSLSVIARPRLSNNDAPLKLAATGRDNPSHTRRTEAVPAAVQPAAVQARSYHHFTPARLEAFVAVAEEGGISAASRRLHISQPALSQTISTLERQVGVDLFVRSSTGVQTTQAGRALLDEARAILARHDQLIGAMAAYTAEGGGVIRLGIPLELAPDVLCALAKFRADHPQTRIEPRQLSMAEQLAALRSGQLDVSFMREKPLGPSSTACWWPGKTWACSSPRSWPRDLPDPRASGSTPSPGWTGWASPARTAPLGTTSSPPSCAPTASTREPRTAATTFRSRR